MLKRYYRKYKNIIDLFLSIVLIISFCAILFTMGNSIVNKDEDYKKVTLNWEVGGLTSTGKYTETKKSIYTKESFSCDGLKTILDFDSNIKYQVFFYDEKDVFISATEILTESKEHNVPENAELARIVITPIWGSDVKKDEQVIKWHDNWFLDNKYSKQLTIKVLKEDEKKNDELDIEKLTFNYEVGDKPEYFYFDLSSFEFSFLSEGEFSDFYNLVYLKNPNNPSLNLTLAFVLESTNIYKFVLCATDEYLLHEELFFRIDISNGANNPIFSDVNSDYVIYDDDYILIDYDFTEYLSSAVFYQNNFKKLN